MRPRKTPKQKNWPDNFAEFLFSFEHDVEEPDYPLNEDQLAAIEYAINTLPIREQVIVNKHYKEGKTYKEISQEFQLCQERIRQLCVQARRRIRCDKMLPLIRYGLKGNEERINQMEEYIEEYKNKDKDKQNFLNKQITVEDLRLPWAVENQLNIHGIKNLEHIIKAMEKDPLMFSDFKWISPDELYEFYRKMEDLGVDISSEDAVFEKRLGKIGYEVFKESR